jgi:hypothetical protein
MSTLAELGKDFVNSKSMVTPGFAGGLVMLLANSLIGAFDLVAYRSFFVLGLSFLVGVVVFIDTQVRPGVRFALYVINSLVVFSVAMGTNSVANQAEEATMPSIGTAIKPIAKIESAFRLTQTLPADSNKVRLQILRDQIKTISNAILLVQGDLVKNQKRYTNPQNKLDSLVRINDELVSIHRKMQATKEFSNVSFIKAQVEMQAVQRNVQAMQKSLLVEKEKRPREGFFKDWN